MLRVRQRWFSARAVLLHFELAVIVAGCAFATYWQAGRALGGNDLSWFYTFEWPVFAGIALAGWWHLIHEDAATRAERLRKREEETEPVHRQAEW
jgi:hypothetical protein